jgi:hypothetical protein
MTWLENIRTIEWDSFSIKEFIKSPLSSESIKNAFENPDNLDQLKIYFWKASNFDKLFEFKNKLKNYLSSQWTNEEKVLTALFLNTCDLTIILSKNFSSDDKTRQVRQDNLIAIMRKSSEYATWKIWKNTLKKMEIIASGNMEKANKEINEIFMNFVNFVIQDSEAIINRSWNKEFLTGMKWIYNNLSKNLSQSASEQSLYQEILTLWRSSWLKAQISKYTWSTPEMKDKWMEHFNALRWTYVVDEIDFNNQNYISYWFRFTPSSSFDSLQYSKLIDHIAKKYNLQWFAHNRLDIWIDDSSENISKWHISQNTTLIESLKYYQIDFPIFVEKIKLPDIDYNFSILDNDLNVTWNNKENDTIPINNIVTSSQQTSQSNELPSFSTKPTPKETPIVKKEEVKVQFIGADKSFITSINGIPQKYKVTYTNENNKKVSIPISKTEYDLYISYKEKYMRKDWSKKPYDTNPEVFKNLSRCYFRDSILFKHPDFMILSATEEKRRLAKHHTNQE